MKKFESSGLFGSVLYDQLNQCMENLEKFHMFMVGFFLLVCQNELLSYLHLFLFAGLLKMGKKTLNVPQLLYGPYLSVTTFQLII